MSRRPDTASVDHVRRPTLADPHGVHPWSRYIELYWLGIIGPPTMKSEPVGGRGRRAGVPHTRVVGGNFGMVDGGGDMGHLPLIRFVVKRLTTYLETHPARHTDDSIGGDLLPIRPHDHAAHCRCRWGRPDGDCSTCRSFEGGLHLRRLRAAFPEGRRWSGDEARSPPQLRRSYGERHPIDRTYTLGVFSEI